MQKLTSLLVVLSLVSYSVGVPFSVPDESLDVWGKKVNVTLELLGPGHVKASMSTKEFSFGWFQHRFPQVDDFSKYAGIYGRYRSRQAGRIEALILLRGEGLSHYYKQTIGDLQVGDGEWVEFYLPFAKFEPNRNASARFATTMLTTNDLLEISVAGLFDDIVEMEFDQLSLIEQGTSEEFIKSILRKMAAQQLKRSIDGSSHPRLLLNGENLERLRKKANAGGNAQACYENLIRQAESLLKSFNADNPFGRVLGFSAAEELTPHKKRASFEGALTPSVRPIETLAAVGLLTGDERFSRHAAKGLVNMARSLDVTTPEIDLGFYYTRTFYVRALAFGYDWLWHFMTEEERRDVAVTLLGFVQDIYDKSQIHSWGRHPLHRVWNWDPGLVSCAGLGILALEGETNLPEEAMLVTFRRHLRDYLTLGVDFDGCGHEGPSYIVYGIGAGVEFMEVLRQQGRGDLLIDTNLQLIAPWLVSELLPNRPEWNNLSDCGHGSVPGCQVYSYVLGRLAELAKDDPMKDGERLPNPANMDKGLDYIQHFSERPGDRKLSYGALAGLMSWAWNHGATPNHASEFSAHVSLAYTLFHQDFPAVEDPAALLPDGMLFRGRGLAVSRANGYGKNGFHLAVEAGPHAAGHDQADKGTFTFRAYGLDFFIDSGYGNDGDPLKSGSAYAHNVVLVDGLGQPCRWHNNSSGSITGYRHGADFDWIRVDAIDAWNFDFAQWIRRPTGRNIKRAERQFVFVRGDQKNIPPYLVLFDDIEKNDDENHDFTWQWHYPTYLEVDYSNPKQWIGSVSTRRTKVLTTAAGKSSAKATFTFTVPADGDYKLFGLTAAFGSVSHKSDSFSLAIGADRIDAWDIAPTNTLTWSAVKERGEAMPRKFTLKAGESFAVELRGREPQAALAKLMLLPYDVEDPLIPIAEPAGAIYYTADEAVMGEPPFLLETFNPGIDSPASISVYPVGRSVPGDTTMEWYVTSQSGSHPKIMHTAHGVKNPGFLMVIVPRADANAPLPLSVERLDGDVPGVVVTWATGRQIVRFPLTGQASPYRKLEFQDVDK